MCPACFLYHTINVQGAGGPPADRIKRLVATLLDGLILGATAGLAFGMGGVVGTGLSDLARWLIGSPVAAYASVFALESLLFVAAASLAWRIRSSQATITSEQAVQATDATLAADATAAATTTRSPTPAGATP